VVNTAKRGLTTVTLRGTNAKREDRLIEEAVIDHVVERRYDTVDRDSIIGKAKNTIEPGSCFSLARR
jgi:hypothetical protein